MALCARGTAPCSARAGGQSRGRTHGRTASDGTKPSPFRSFSAREHEWQVGTFSACPHQSGRAGCAAGQTPRPQWLGTRPISCSATRPWWAAGSPGPRRLQALLSQPSQKMDVVSLHWLQTGAVSSMVGTDVGDQHSRPTLNVAANAENTSFLGRRSPALLTLAPIHSASKILASQGGSSGQSSIHTGHPQTLPMRPLVPCLVLQGHMEAMGLLGEPGPPTRSAFCQLLSGGWRGGLRCPDNTL